MTARPLTPPLALAYLRVLSTDIRAAAVLDGQWRCLAGEASLATQARELLAPGGSEIVLRSAPAAGGGVLVACAQGDVAIVVVAGPHALLRLLEHDLRTLLGELEGGTASDLLLGADPASAD